MRRPVIVAGLIAVIMALSACSQETQQKTGEAAEAAGEDVKAAAGTAGDEISKAASKAASEAGEALEKVGDRIEEERAEDTSASPTETPTQSEY